MKPGDMIRVQTYRSDLDSEGLLHIQILDDDLSNVRYFLEEDDIAMIIYDCDILDEKYFYILTNDCRNGWVLESMVESIS